jgi:hypothetical protein
MSVTGPGRSRAIGAAAALAVALAIPPARAQVVCEQVGGTPPDTTTVHVEIRSPAPGTVVPALTGCKGEVLIEGTWWVRAPPLLFDFYIVIDESGSTAADSGADVDGDGIRFEADDNILHAEIAAARAFVMALDPALSRVAVISFNRSASLRQPLSGNISGVVLILDAMRSDTPRFGTGYVPAMAAVEAEVNARGDRVSRRQRCLFLSDGAPDEALALTDAAASRLAALGVVMDTFALGAINSQALENMAAITGGRFTALLNPGDIVALLPSFVPDVTTVMTSGNDTTGNGGTAVPDVSGTFSATVPLVVGSNTVTIELSAGDPVIASVRCSIDVTLAPGLAADAGPAVSACRGGSATLDGSGSWSACAAPLYRWLDCAGAEACTWSTDATCPVVLDGTCDRYVLEIACPGETCSHSDDTIASLLPDVPAAPEVLGQCWRDVAIGCGSTDPALRHAWDADLWDDSDGDGNPGNDQDLAGCDQSLVFAGAGPQLVRLFSYDDATGCMAWADLAFDTTDPPLLEPVLVRACALDVDIACGTLDPAFRAAWDTDLADDSDGDGDPANDEDVAGCDQSLAYTSNGRQTVRLLVVDDATGCRDSEDLDFNTSPPPPVRDIAGGACPLAVLSLSCGNEPPGATTTWDLDATTDGDGNGDPADDVDAAGCEVDASWPDEGGHDVRAWQTDADGCRFLVASGVLTIDAGAVPGEVPDLRVDHGRGRDIRLSWGGVPGSNDHRVLRGTIDSLFRGRTYDHVADDVAGAGTCHDPNRVFDDPDDLDDSVDYYYLVTALNDCAGEGPTGNAWGRRGLTPRPPRLPSPSCP